MNQSEGLLSAAQNEVIRRALFDGASFLKERREVWHTSLSAVITSPDHDTQAVLLIINLSLAICCRQGDERPGNSQSTLVVFPDGTFWTDPEIPEILSDSLIVGGLQNVQIYDSKPLPIFTVGNGWGVVSLYHWSGGVVKRCFLQSEGDGRIEIFSDIEVGDGGQIIVQYPQPALSRFPTTFKSNEGSSDSDKIRCTLRDSQLIPIPVQ